MRFSSACLILQQSPDTEKFRDAKGMRPKMTLLTAPVKTFSNNVHCIGFNTKGAGNDGADPKTYITDAKVKGDPFKMSHPTKFDE